MRVDISDKNRSTTQFFVWGEWDSVSKKKIKFLKLDLSQFGWRYYDEDKIITIIYVDLKTRFVI